MNTVSWQLAHDAAAGREQPERRLRAAVRRGRHDGRAARSDEEEAQPARSRQQDLARLQQTLGPGDRARVSEYLDAVREVERRIQTAEEQNATSTLPVPDRPVGIPAQVRRSLKLLFDLQWLAYPVGSHARVHADVRTRIEQPPYPEIGISEPHHGLSHHGDNPAQLEKYCAAQHAATRSCSPTSSRSCAPRRTATAPCSTTASCSTAAAMSNPNVHLHVNLPLVVAGGGAGRSRAAATCLYAWRQRAR